MNHLTEEELVIHHYGDAGGTAAIDEHLRACPACQADLDEVRRTLAAVESLPAPDPGDGYGAAVWARIQPGLARPPLTWRERLRAVARRAALRLGRRVAPSLRAPRATSRGEALRYPALTPRKLAWAGGAAAVFLAAFVAGRQVAWQWPGVSPAPQVAQAPAAATQPTAVDRELVQADVLRVAVSDHLDRSQMTLSELVNTPRGPEMDISDEQERARDLVSENRLFRQTALRTGEPAVASVLDDLERVLVEVANGPSTLDEAQFDRVRNRIEQQGIIFKVRVFGERVREADTRPIVRAGLRG